MGSYVVAISIIARNGELGNLLSLWIKYKHIDIITILSREINLAIAPSPIYALDTWIEILGEWSNLLGGDIEEEEFVLGHAWCNICWQLTTYAIEGLRITCEQNLFAIRREATTTQKLSCRKQGIYLQRLGIDHEDIRNRCGTLSQTRVIAANQQLATIL